MVTRASVCSAWSEEGLPCSELFEAVGASVAGPRHMTRGIACQDFFKVEVKDDWITAVVSDGAGSATRALEGARIVSQEICGVFADRLALSSSHSQQGWIAFRAWAESAVTEGIERARERCLIEAGHQESLAAFHATVVGVVMIRDRGALFHVGDGCVSAYRHGATGIETIGFSGPENGEYANETFFFTEDWWREHLRVTELRDPPDAVWLMSDGAYELAVPPNQKELREFTVRETERLLFDEHSTTRADVLTEILSLPQATQRNDDDKTLVIIKRRSRWSSPSTSACTNFA